MPQADQPVEVKIDGKKDRHGRISNKEQEHMAAIARSRCLTEFGLKKPKAQKKE